MAAVNKQLSGLHEMLTEYLTQRLKECMKEGNDPMPAAELSVLRQFLKDNGIVADKDFADDLQALQDQLQSEKSDASRKEILATAISKIADESGIMH
jgi:hypothetical protein